VLVGIEVFDAWTDIECPDSKGIKTMVHWVARGCDGLAEKDLADIG
jgi:hypothetical protein